MQTDNSNKPIKYIMKTYLILFIAAISTTLFVGCSSDDDFNPPNYVTFADVTANSDELYVSVDSEGSETVDLTVFAGNQTGSARTFDVIVDESSTLDPSAYTIPETVTIPANSNEATISVELTGSGIDNEGDILVLQLENENGYVGDPLTINVLKVCPFDASGWVGTYDVSEVFTDGDNEGLSLAAAFEESYQVELLENPDDNSSVVVTNSEGFDQYFEEGTVLTFGACAGNIRLSNRDIAAGFGTLTITDSSYDETAGTITATGTLGNYGEYQFVLTRQESGDGTDGEETDGDDADGDNTDGDDTDE